MTESDFVAGVVSGVPATGSGESTRIWNATLPRGNVWVGGSENETITERCLRKFTLDCTHFMLLVSGLIVAVRYSRAPVADDAGDVGTNAQAISENADIQPPDFETDRQGLAVPCCLLLTLAVPCFFPCFAVFSQFVEV